MSYILRCLCFILRSWNVFDFCLRSCDAYAFTLRSWDVFDYCLKSPDSYVLPLDPVMPMLLPLDPKMPKLFLLDPVMPMLLPLDPAMPKLFLLDPAMPLLLPIDPAMPVPSPATPRCFDCGTCGEARLFLNRNQGWRSNTCSCTSQERIRVRLHPRGKR